jgi:hypothetical protein
MALTPQELAKNAEILQKQAEPKKNSPFATAAEAAEYNKPFEDLRIKIVEWAKQSLMDGPLSSSVPLTASSSQSTPPRTGDRRGTH